jgi:Concanavalin A-like lectin/glucanases superfamily
MQSGTRRRLQAAAGAIAVGQTYHVLGTYDGATQRLYVNGTQVASAPLTGAITTNANALALGSWNGGSEPFNGTIDEVAVYSAALPAARALAHYQAGSPSQPAALSGSLSFSNGPQLVSTSGAGSTPYSIGSPPPSYTYLCHLPLAVVQS